VNEEAKQRLSDPLNFKFLDMEQFQTLLSCPFNLVLAFLFSTGATLNHLCSSQTSVSLYREKGGLDLWLPAHVC